MNIIPKKIIIKRLATMQIQLVFNIAEKSQQHSRINPGLGNILTQNLSEKFRTF